MSNVRWLHKLKTKHKQIIGEAIEILWNIG